MQFSARETLTEQVAQYLEDQIVHGQMHSGERIIESSMAKKLDVSHGCVREALLLIEKRYLVKIVPRKGTFVTTLDEDFVRALYETLLLILGNTGRKLVREWRDEDMQHMEALYLEMKASFEAGKLQRFHELGIEYTQASLVYARNHFIVEMINNLWPSAKRCSFLALQQGPQIIYDNLDYMRRSLDLIRTHDEVGLIELLEAYGTKQCEQVLACIKPKRPL
ncbi:GntR family transcriptional regulator [Allohahella sp. A8]|uniref:GntR family transcriptional regulator n=1 Tax=Allohahella sp. A8 TaxID=3141461 RepID=UPI000C090AC9|nr:GntR family transcriptional regulator [Hahellaceae bacterium]|tara:strand:- start:61343 stop:62008 length:666 start_codon:yes stop_codon:yes gene_type:complete